MLAGTTASPPGHSNPSAPAIINIDAQSRSSTTATAQMPGQVAP
jgi:hypothetical protein